MKIVVFVNGREIIVLGIPEEQVQIINYDYGMVHECPSCSAEEGEELQGEFCYSCGSDWSDKDIYSIYEALTNE